MAKDPSIHDYYRHYEAPGVGHCYTATGLYPQGIFASLIKWVEQGIKPDTLDVDVSGLTGPPKHRILCPYPQRSKYKGSGDTNSVDSYYCG
jgi:Tannase and feruloyl esterase